MPAESASIIFAIGLLVGFPLGYGVRAFIPIDGAKQGDDDTFSNKYYRVYLASGGLPR